MKEFGRKRKIPGKSRENLFIEFILIASTFISCFQQAVLLEKWQVHLLQMYSNQVVLKVSRHLLRCPVILFNRPFEL
jgi:hypothetical protein